MQSHPFKRGQLIFGSLTPWRGEWYWSGEQRLLGDASQVDIADLIQTMKRTNSHIVCRYSKNYEAQTREQASKLHGKMLAFYGKDLVVYPDGMSMAADWQKELRTDWESRPKQEVEEVVSYAAEALESILAEGAEKAMTKHNRRAQGLKTEEE